MFRIFDKGLPKNQHTDKLLVNIRNAAEEYAGKPIEDLSFSMFRTFFETGDRVAYEDKYIDHRRRLVAYSVLCINGEDYIKELEDSIWAVCNEFTWALPAHIRGYKTCDMPFRIDLFSSETAITLCEVLSLLEDVINPIVADRIRFEVKRRIIEPYVTGKEKLANHANWAAICTAGVGIPMMYLCDREDTEAQIPKLVDNINGFLNSYEDDGCCGEGPLYWEYGFGFYCIFADMLYKYTDGKIDLMNSEKVHNIALYRQNVVLKDKYVIPFADTLHDFAFHIGLTHFLAQKFDDVLPVDEKYEVLFDEDFRYRLPILLRDFKWYNEDLNKKAESKDFFCFENSMQYIFRRDKFTLAVKGGHNDEPHNHNDLGSFVVYTDDGFVLDDPGWSDYDDKYFTEERYNNICASSFGHSTLIINGKEQLKGKKAITKVLASGENYIELDLTDVYGVNCKRRFEINENIINIYDSFSDDEFFAVQRFVTRIEPEVEDGKVRIGKTQIEAAGAELEGIKIKTFKPRINIYKSEMKEVETLYLIDFKVNNLQNGSTIRIIN